nr:diguanylate cyclase [Domibacillus iocasae]
MSFELNWFGLTLLVYLSPLIENGEVTEVAATAFDITERKEAERQIEKMTHYDNLTGLANRRLFQKKLLNELNRAFEKTNRSRLCFWI